MLSVTSCVVPDIHEKNLGSIIERGSSSFNMSAVIPVKLSTVSNNVQVLSIWLGLLPKHNFIVVVKGFLLVIGKVSVPDEQANFVCN